MEKPERTFWPAQYLAEEKLIYSEKNALRQVYRDLLWTVFLSLY